MDKGSQYKDLKQEFKKEKVLLKKIKLKLRNEKFS